MKDGTTVRVAMDQASEITLHGVISMLRQADADIHVISAKEQHLDLTQADVTLIDTTFDTPSRDNCGC